MPSEARPLRGRTRHSARVWRGARSRQISNEMKSKPDNPATGSHPRGSPRGRRILVAATPLPYWQASLRGHRAERKRYLNTIWEHRRFFLLVGLIWILLLLGGFLIVGFPYSLTPSDYLLRSNDNSNGQSPKHSTWKTVLSFFSPTTCIPKEDQVVETCTGLTDLNQSECLKLKCCYSSHRTSNFNCFTPLEDKTTRMLRIFVLGMLTMIVLACVPLVCCSLWRRSCSRGAKGTTASPPVFYGHCNGIQHGGGTDAYLFTVWSLGVCDQGASSVSVLFRLRLAGGHFHCALIAFPGKWANPLRKKVNKMVKGLKKQRIKPKKGTEVSRPAVEDEEALGDEVEDERRGVELKFILAVCLFIEQELMEPCILFAGVTVMIKVDLFFLPGAHSIAGEEVSDLEGHTSSNCSGTKPMEQPGLASYCDELGFLGEKADHGKRTRGTWGVLLCPKMAVEEHAECAMAAFYKVTLFSDLKSRITGGLEGYGARRPGCEGDTVPPSSLLRPHPHIRATVPTTILVWEPLAYYNKQNASCFGLLEDRGPVHLLAEWSSCPESWLSREPWKERFRCSPPRCREEGYCMSKGAVDLVMNCQSFAAGASWPGKAL
ncbi:PREDICTED: fragile X mental retardation 1 neighbor protein [Condylura cristata]|uniref:fragile X mental retardation 1 neighbor protein n=1 Tax=Condylura cristata TaxID=143302 RepID=UPI000642B9DB|nr:PREDICTED: fragile X mental retardation 1 neighbor protein [Condylura cristata]